MSAEVSIDVTAFNDVAVHRLPAARSAFDLRDLLKDSEWSRSVNWEQLYAEYRRLFAFYSNDPDTLAWRDARKSRLQSTYAARRARW